MEMNQQLKLPTKTKGPPQVWLCLQGLSTATGTCFEEMRSKEDSQWAHSFCSLDGGTKAEGHPGRGGSGEAGERQGSVTGMGSQTPGARWLTPWKQAGIAWARM